MSVCECVSAFNSLRLWLTKNSRACLYLFLLFDRIDIALLSALELTRRSFRLGLRVHACWVMLVFP